MKKGPRSDNIEENSKGEKPHVTGEEFYSPSVASFSYFVTFDVLKTPLMLRAVKRKTK